MRVNDWKYLHKVMCEIQAKNRGEAVITDSDRIDWLKKIMTPDCDYCEVYLSGLRDFKTGKSGSISDRIKSGKIHNRYRSYVPRGYR